MDFLNIYPTIPVQIKRGEGPYLFSSSGKKYLDLIGGIGVNVLGYRDPEVMSILGEAGIIPHLSNLYMHTLREDISMRLNKLCGSDRVFFTNSGTESNEAALKFAWKMNPGKILSFEGSFHGRSLGSFSLSHLFIHQDFPRIDAPVDFVRWNNPRDLREKGRDASIIILEPIQGAGGVRVMNKECFGVLKELKKRGTIVIADEIQSGLGRTGEFLACSHNDFQPDVVTLAKGLGGGIPLGAVCMKEEIASNLKVGDHGSTMGGNLKALRLAGVVLERLLNQLMEHIRDIENSVVERYRSGLEIRGRGLFLGFDVSNGEDFARIMREKGYLVNIVRKNTVRLLPPYIIRKEELTEFFDVAGEVI
jgi:acetylornithine/succinyldiaminopimelate/putrescine aminotransferase